MTANKQLEWPVLTHYDQDHLARIALPLGGIGTGTVSLGGRGNLRDWEIMDFPAKGFTPDGSLFALYAKPAGKPAVARCLEGPIPFDETECGHHYARAMASWAAILALTGFHYSAVEKVMTFAPKIGRHFWSTGYAWGRCVISKVGEGYQVELMVQHGSLPLRSLRLTGKGEISLPRARVLGSGKFTVHRKPMTNDANAVSK